MDEARAVFDSSTQRLDEFAWNINQSQSTETLLKDEAVAFVSQSVLKSLLKDEEIQTTELTLFQALIVWTNAKSHLVGEGHAASGHKKRRRNAKSMTKHIMLERISPPDLSNIVEPSGLVSNDQLLQAYKSQAMRLEQKFA